MAHPEDIPDGASPGESGHVTDHNKISTALVNIDDRLHTVEIAAPTGMTQEQIQDMLYTFLVAGPNVTISYNDVANTLTISAAGGGPGGVTDHGALTGLTSAGAHPATAVSHSVSGSIITPGTVNGALSDLDIGVAFASNGLSTHLADTVDAHDASAISVVATGFNGNLATTDDTVQKVAQKVDDLLLGAGGDVAAHLADTTNAHAATSIDHTVSGSFITPGSVQGALSDLDTTAAVVNAAINNHLADTVDAHDASAISVVSAGFNGNLAPADDTVQKALQKLDDLVFSSLNRGTERFGVDGTVGTTPRLSPHRIYNDSGVTRTITAVRATATTPDGAVTLIADVNVNGSTIFPTQSERPTIPLSGSTHKATRSAAWADGAYISVDVDQAGPAHANLDINVEWTS